MNWQTVDFSKLIKMVATEIPLRPIRRAFIESLLKPLSKIQSTVLYKMQHDSKVISLEKMLNEYLQIPTYDPMSHLATRQVIIYDAPKLAPTYIYQTSEDQPVYLGTEYLDRNSTISYQFIVKIPVAVEFDETLVRAEIDFYKLAGKNYIIETY